MTEEQIKKKADKYLKAYTDRSIHITKDRLLQLMIREAFIDGYKAGFKDCAKSRLNVTTISDCPIKDDWHYVKDGEYPKDESKVLCILGDFENDNCEVGYYFQGKQEDNKRWCFQNYNLPDDSEEDWGVSAWKEIVLPKEIV